jgi:cation diffusion facilitator family transporter
MKAALRAMSLRGLLIAVEMIGFWLYGSQALLMDALSSTMDLVSSFLLLFCLYLAKSPPDRNHPFGHGRIEPIAGMLLGVFLIQAGLYLAYNQFQTFEFAGETISSHAAFFALAAAMIMEVCYHMMRRYAKRHHSSAMMAEATHYRTDALNSLLAFAALALAGLFPEQGFYFVRIGALLIALSIVYLGAQTAKENFDQIIDKRPDEEMFERIRKAATRIEGVKGTEKIGIQHYGPDAHVDIDIEVDPQASVDVAHRLSQRVRREIQSDWPAVRDVTVHIEPYFEGDH